MNYPYVSDPNRALKTVLSRNPTLSLQDLQAAHPMLRTLCRDQLSVRLAAVIEGRSPTNRR